MKRLLLLFFILSAAPLLAGNLHLFEDDGKYGFKDDAGRVRIPARYSMATEFNRHGVASVIEGSKAYLIDSTGVKKFEMFIFDNGPDYFEDGLARFIEKGKMGFFDETGKKVIPASFDFVYPFESGYAIACNACRKVYSGEHWRMTGGVWLVIDKKGRQAVSAGFDDLPVIDKGTVTGLVRGQKKSLPLHQ